MEKGAKNTPNKNNNSNKDFKGFQTSRALTINQHSTQIWTLLKLGLCKQYQNQCHTMIHTMLQKNSFL